MLSFFDVLKLNNIDSACIRLVRHSNKEIPILQTFNNNRDKFEIYQRFQSPNKFNDAKQVAVFAPYRKTLALFLGIWDIKDYLTENDFSEQIHLMIDEYEFSQEWHKGQSYYHLVYNPVLEEFSQRLIVEWGGGTLAWVQKQDKNIIEIKDNNSLADLPTFDKIILTHSELKKIVSNKESNNDWLNALSSVKGIYLIRDSKSGELYVGSASGDDGLFGRWQEYVLNGHGGNEGLKSLDPNYFEYSILEIVSNLMTKSEIIHKENMWKLKLGTWENGLNRFEKHNKISNNVV